MLSMGGLKAGYDLAVSVRSALEGKAIKYWEIGNEVDLMCLKRPADQTDNGLTQKTTTPTNMKDVAGGSRALSQACVHGIRPRKSSWVVPAGNTGVISNGFTTMECNGTTPDSTGIPR